MRRALAGKTLTCMPAGDSKNEPHQEKSLLSSFSVGAQDDGARIATARVPSQLLTTREMNASAGSVAACARARRWRAKF